MKTNAIFQLQAKLSQLKDLDRNFKLFGARSHRYRRFILSEEKIAGFAFDLKGESLPW